MFSPARASRTASRVVRQPLFRPYPRGLGLARGYLRSGAGPIYVGSVKEGIGRVAVYSANLSPLPILQAAFGLMSRGRNEGAVPAPQTCTKKE